jgi:hypothetical protein
VVGRLACPEHSGLGLEKLRYILCLVISKAR